jgi:AcrR family transcriptional regulator
MTSRQAAAAKTRSTLISTGLRLAEQTGLGGLSVNLLVERAGVSKGTFFHHFGDRTTYLLALHRDFHERLLAEIMDAIEGMSPGAERLMRAATTYLDACVRDRGVRALLLEARAVPEVLDAVRARNRDNAKLCEADFRSMGWSRPAACARLWVGLVAEAAIVELEDGGRSAAVRHSLAQFVGHGPRAV